MNGNTESMSIPDAPPDAQDLLAEAEAFLVARDGLTPVPDDQAGQTFSSLTAEQAAALPDPIPRPDYILDSLDRALWFLEDRPQLPDAASRAAIILRSRPDDPELQREYGARAATWLEGHTVKCATCRARWTADPVMPYLNASTATNGTCAPCFTMRESRPDAATPVLTGRPVDLAKVVTPQAENGKGKAKARTTRHRRPLPAGDARD